MSEPAEAALHAAGIGPRLKAALEFGPILGFVAVYLVVREQAIPWRAASGTASCCWWAASCRWCWPPAS